MIEHVEDDPRFAKAEPESGSGKLIIRGLAVRNFRTVPDQGLIVRLSRLTTLAGPNNCGKTTLLRALELFITDRVEGRPLTEEDFHNRDTSKPVIVEALLGNLPEDLSQALGENLLADGRLLIRKEFRMADGRVQTLVLAQGEDFEAPSLRGLLTKNRDELVKIATGIGAARARSNAERAAKILEKALQLGYRRVKTWIPLGIETARALQGSLPTPATVSAFSTPAETERFVQALLQRPVEVALGKLGSIQDEVKHAVTQAAEEFFSEVEEAMKAQDPSILDLEPRVSVSLPRSVVTQFEITDTGGHTSDLYYKGAGTQRNLIIAATRIASEWEDSRGEERAKPGLLLLIDEPEVFLHPGAQRNLFEVLERLSSKDNQVVMSTHSTIFIDTTFLHNVVLLKRSSAGVEVIQLPEKTEDPESAIRTYALIREDLGIRNSDIFFSNVVFLCEGKSDERFLKAAYELVFKEAPEARSVHIKQIGGKDKLSPLGEMLPILKSLQVPFAIMLDSDAISNRGSRAIIRRLSDRGILDTNVCRVWRRGEIEEYYPPSLLLRALESWAKERDLVLEVSEDEIREAIKSGGVSAYKSIRRVCNDRVRRVPTKDDLARHVANGLKKQDIASEVATVLTWSLVVAGLLTADGADAVLKEWSTSIEESLPPSVTQKLTAG